MDSKEFWNLDATFQTSHIAELLKFPEEIDIDRLMNNFEKQILIYQKYPDTRYMDKESQDSFIEFGRESLQYVLRNYPDEASFEATEHMVSYINGNRNALANLAGLIRKNMNKEQLQEFSHTIGKNETLKNFLTSAEFQTIQRELLPFFQRMRAKLVDILS